MNTRIAIVVRCLYAGSMVTASACASDQNRIEAHSEPLVYFECGGGIRYPTTRADFLRVYADRPFGASGNHLGRDILYTEGTAIHPIACGRLIVYRPSEGYGTLVVVVEHTLSSPVTVMNGASAPFTIRSFLSIYGHLRPSVGRLDRSATSEDRARATNTRFWSEVQRLSGGVPQNYWTYAGTIPVFSEDVVGYVEHHEFPDGSWDDLNGDGREHCHLGIRLQSYAEARLTDPCFYRGYDMGRGVCRMPSQFRLFADPAIFLMELANALPVMWHPVGSFLVNGDDPSAGYLVTSDTSIVRMNPTYRALERLDRVAIPVSTTELNCYNVHEWTLPPSDGIAFTTHVRFDGDPAVYELHDLGAYRYAFISLEAMLSWGLTEADVHHLPASERLRTLGRYTDRGPRRMRPGSLVRALRASEVAFVTETERLPFFDWETFVAMGYEHQTIYEVDASVIDEVAHRRGAMITPELTRLCRVPSCSGDRCSGASPVGGGGVSEEEDAGTPTPPLPPDAGPPPSGGCVPSAETCNNLDDNCDGIADNGIANVVSSNDCGAVEETCAGGRWIRISGRDPEAERCRDGVDNNCNGTVDEGCAPVCTPVAETCNNADDNCDGRIDESLSRGCSTLCGSGTETCSAGRYVGCTAPVPGTETCNGIDDDCDGSIDEGVCVPPPPPPPVTDPNLVRIRLTSTAQAECTLGWRIKLWLTVPAVESPRGGQLERIVSPGSFGPWSSVTLWCDERSPQWYVFDVASVHALGTGIFAELSMGGVDLRSSTMVCEDPASPGTGYRPIMMWDVSRRGSCPP